MPDIYAALAAMARRAAKEARAAAATAQADDVIADSALLLPWEPGKYAIGDVRTHAGQPWRCCQAHDSVGNEAWAPATRPRYGPRTTLHLPSGHCLMCSPLAHMMPTRRASTCAGRMG